MPYKNDFLVPEYYTRFACKCGDCRETCCRGWGIALSMDEYFHTIGTDCSDELRRRLDIAFRPATNPAPTPERYVMISHNWQGDCPIQAPDGYCMLHRECGEGAIPEICRRYPRAMRTKPIHECCTSSSCEHTLELLFEDEAPLRFCQAELEFLEDSFDEHPAAAIDAAEYTARREAVFAILADRSLSIDARLDGIGRMLGVETVPRLSGAQTAELCELLARSSGALAALLEEGSADGGFSLESLPKMDIYIEKLLANHIFYKGFPHSFSDSTPRDEMASLAAVIALHRYVCEPYLAKHGWSMENFIDCTAKLFRMIEHSRFDESVARFVGKM